MAGKNFKASMDFAKPIHVTKLGFNIIIISERDCTSKINSRKVGKR